MLNSRLHFFCHQKFSPEDVIMKLLQSSSLVTKISNRQLVDGYIAFEITLQVVSLSNQFMHVF